MEAFLRETELLKAIDHPFIVRFIQSYEADSWVYHLTELLTGGTLSKALPLINKKSTEIQKFYIGALFLIFEYLHSKSVAYRNFKPEIVMLDSTGYPKVIDFLHAKKISGRTYTSAGTPHYMAPEVIGGKGYGTVADLWSLGVFCYFLVYGKMPFGDGETQPLEICKAVVTRAGEVSNELSQVDIGKSMQERIAAKLCRGFLEPNPGKRLGAGFTGNQEIRDHLFFQVPGVDIDDQQETHFDMLLSRSIDPPYVPSKEVLGRVLTKAEMEEEEKSEAENDEEEEDEESDN